MYLCTPLPKPMPGPPGPRDHPKARGKGSGGPLRFGRPPNPRASPADGPSLLAPKLAIGVGHCGSGGFRQGPAERPKPTLPYRRAAWDLRLIAAQRLRKTLQRMLKVLERWM